jgi:hypothetical protein
MSATNPSQVTYPAPLPLAEPGRRPTGPARSRSVRRRVTGTDPSTPGFVGVAPAPDADWHLSAVRHSRHTELVDPATDFVQRPESAPMSPAGDSEIWVAEASGPGTAELREPEQEGLGRLLVMNADGSAGVGVPTDISASAPVQRLVGRWLLIGARRTVDGPFSARADAS